MAVGPTPLCPALTVSPMMRMGLPPEGGAQVVTLGRVALDGTRLKDNASTHKAMSYGRMPEREGFARGQVDETAQVIVASAVTADPTDTPSLPGLVEQVHASSCGPGRAPASRTPPVRAFRASPLAIRSASTAITDRALRVPAARLLVCGLVDWRGVAMGDGKIS